jgi:hypothetical protein
MCLEKGRQEARVDKDGSAPLVENRPEPVLNLAMRAPNP